MKAREQVLVNWTNLKEKLETSALITNQLKLEAETERSWITMWINSNIDSLIMSNGGDTLLGASILRTLRRKGVELTGEKRKIDFKIIVENMQYKEWISGDFDFSKKDLVRETILEVIRDYYKGKYHKLLTS